MIRLCRSEADSGPAVAAGAGTSIRATNRSREAALARSNPITLAALPLTLGSTGEEVSDLQRRLRAAGFPVEDDSGTFGPGTQSMVRAFQRAHGLREDGVCGASTWSALIEAEYKLGDRLLCLRSPMMRGDDVADLQLRLGALGFDAGRVDGIFGPLTRAAVGDFQRNAGLVSDEVCGPDTVDALMRLEGRAGSASVTAVREREHLRRSLGSLVALRVVVGAGPRAGSLMADLASSLQRAGVSVLLCDGEWSDQATRANDFGADVYLGLDVAETRLVQASYFSVPGYESHGGRRLAELVVKELPASPGWGVGSTKGMRLPILRETRAPAVLVELGGLQQLQDNAGLVVASFQRALDGWAADPC